MFGGYFPAFAAISVVPVALVVPSPFHFNKMKFESYPVGVEVAVVGIALLLAGIYVPSLKQRIVASLRAVMRLLSD